jgi:hypothetical protein
MATSSADRRQGVNSSAAVKVPCKAATTAAITLSGEQTIDGVALVADDRVLVKDQASGADNGIYVVGTGDWSRAKDWDGAYDVKEGTFVYVTDGSTNTGFWYVTTADPITVGTTSVALARASSVLAAVSAFVQTLLDDADGSAFLETLADSATAETAPATGDLVLLSDVSANNGRKMTLEDLLSLYQRSQPGGRLTLTTAVPVTTSDVSGATTVYYSPYKSNIVELYDGAKWVPKTFTEMSQTTSDTTKSPAAVANSSNYDVFVWSDSGTLRATRGPAWSSDTARGAGAGTTELEQFEGRYVNKVAITNGPAARRGLYVGTIRSDGSAQINDTNVQRHVWNNHNRVQRAMRVIEGTDSWTYSTATYRQANGSAANQLDIVIGLSEDAVSADVLAIGSNSGATVRGLFVGVGIDSTSVNSGTLNIPAQCTNTVTGAPRSRYQGFPGIGRHTIVWLERAEGTDTQTWFGDNGDTTLRQTGIFGQVMA